MSKYLELFKGAFDDSIGTKTKLENKPYIGYSLTDSKLAYTVVPKPITGPADNEIWYTSTDGNVITPNVTDVFGANIISNTYEDGKGVIKFDGPVTSIGWHAFYECSSLTSITIPNSVTSIGMYAFWGCSSLTSVTIPNSVTSIGESAFCSCYSLTSITIPNSVTSIGDMAFYFCSSLTSITIPNSVTSIRNQAFDSCESLTSVTIPNSVTSIGGWAFNGCSGLNYITYEGTQEQWNAVSKGNNWKYKVPATYVQCSDGQVSL